MNLDELLGPKGNLRLGHLGLPVRLMSPMPAITAQLLKVRFKGTSTLCVQLWLWPHSRFREGANSLSLLSTETLHWGTGLPGCPSIYHGAVMLLPQHTRARRFSSWASVLNSGLLLHSFYPPYGWSPESLSWRKVPCYLLKTSSNDDCHQFFSFTSLLPVGCLPHHFCCSTFWWMTIGCALYLSLTYIDVSS